MAKETGEGDSDGKAFAEADRATISIDDSRRDEQIRSLQLAVAALERRASPLIHGPRPAVTFPLDLAAQIRAGWADGSKLVALTAGDNPRPVWERGSFASHGIRKLAAELDTLARRLEAAVADGARTDQAREEVRDVAVSLGDCSVALVVAARGIE